MTLSQVITYAEQIYKQRLGYQAVSLTNYDNDSEPQIAAGSKIEIGGALFEAPADESITGWGGISNNSDVYIRLVVSGSTAIAEFTTAAPTWSTSKQGWYDAGGIKRYIGGLRKDGSGNYRIKWVYTPADTDEMRCRGATRPWRRKVLETGDWNMYLTDIVNLPHGLPCKEKIRNVTAIVRDDVGIFYRLDGNYIGITIYASDQGGIGSITANNLVLWRRDGGGFHTTYFDSTGYNRGWVTIKYEA